MNGEIPSVPITTLAGIASLTDLLPEMPLPSPLPQTLSNKSLLFHPRVAEEAHILLSLRDETLVPQLVQSLIQTSADHIELKDHYAGTEPPVDQQQNVPELLKAILHWNPNVFKGPVANSPRPPQTWNTSPGSCQGHIQNQQIQGQSNLLLKQQVQLSPAPGYDQVSSSPSYPSPCASRHTPQGSPAHPAPARLPLAPPSHITSHNLGPPHTLTPPPSLTPTAPATPAFCDRKQLVISPQISDGNSNEKEPSLQSVVIKEELELDMIKEEPVQNLSVNSSQPLISGGGAATGGGGGINKYSVPIRDNINSSETPLPPPPSSIPRAHAPLMPGSSPAQASIAPMSQDKDSTVAIDYDKRSSSLLNSKMKEPVVRLNRLTMEDLMQRSMKSSVKNNDIGATKNHHPYRIESGSESEDEPRSKNKYFKAREKEREIQRRKEKDNRKKIDKDDEYLPDEFESSLSERIKKRKRNSRCTEENNSASHNEDASIVPKTKLRKLERKLVPVLEKLSVEELMETNTYQRFSRSIEKIFDNTEDLDLAVCDDEDDTPPEHAMIPKYQLEDLCAEAAKLKTLGAMESIPSEKITRLLSILEKNIRDGAKVSPIGDPNDDEEERKLFMELAMERVMRAVDASLTTLYILTSPNMHKRVYLEDVIDRVVIFTKYQLHNTIYPAFDPVYRIDPKDKDGYVGSARKKRAHTKEVREKSVLILYNKLIEVVSLLSELLSIQTLTDTAVLHASSMGISPFFVESVSELQLAALKLVTTIFTKYEKHRKLLLDDILASMARLPSSKRSLRSYRLNSEEYIQMLTALVLQLIQCMVVLPPNLDSKQQGTNSPDPDVIIVTKFNAARTTASNFLYVFLAKCSSKSEEIDYRPLFENFVQDLLTTVNKPEWPAAELMLSVLGTLLVANFVNKGLEMSLRVASLDYLGVVAARLRKDAVVSNLKIEAIDQIIQEIKAEELKDDDGNIKGDVKGVSCDEERIQFLQRVLLDYLAVQGQVEPALTHARHFYLAQWYQDNTVNNPPSASKPSKTNSKSKKHKRKRESSEEESSSSLSEEEEEDDKKKNVNNSDDPLEQFRINEARKKFLLSKIRPFQDTVSNDGVKTQTLQTYIDYDSAELVARYLASKRPFSQSFNTYLKHILKVLTESSVLIRTKAMKCLTMIVEVDPGVLGLKDMQLGVSHSFLDHSTSVREAAVDLVGKFVLSRPELISKYYDMLSARILDTGVSVRKRVIKILKDICIECPDFPKIPEICVKMIRRVNDEDGIRKLVMEVFQNMWFTPVREKPSVDTEVLIRKVMNITDVVAASRDMPGLEWFEQLLLSLFKPKEDKEDSRLVLSEPPKALLTACKQIVDCLIENVIRLDGRGSGSSQRLVACMVTLFLFAKIRPQLLVDHAITLQPYLSLKCQTQGDYQIISYVARILELVVPLIEHPSDTFLARLEEDSVKLIVLQDIPVILSCVSCLGSVVNNVTRNFKLIRDCLKKYHGFLLNYRTYLETGKLSPNVMKYKLYRENDKEAILRPIFRRSVYIVGLLMRFFDFQDKEVLGDQLPEKITQDVFETFSFFLSQDEDSKYYTLKAIGNVCIRHYDLMLGPVLKTLYHQLLKEEDAPLSMKVQVLKNIEIYLQEEERRMIKQDLEWAKLSKQENLKEMGDVSSGMASTVIQLYLKEILESFLHPQVSVRQAALQVIQLILGQGLVHPVQIVPYLICMSTDVEKMVSNSADKQLQEIEKKYPGFIHMKAQTGIRLSYKLQRILQFGAEVVRGFRVKEGELPGALNGFLYSILRTKQQRRALVLSILKQFDEQVKTSLSQMLYLADNMAYFPYQVQDEPLFIIHHIDIMISVTGTNLLQSFREALIPTGPPQDQRVDPETGNPLPPVDEEEDEDEAVLLSRVPEDTHCLQECLTASQGCLLLLVLKQHLKTLYGFNDSKITQYSPSESAKIYEKAVNRKSNSRFNPKATLQKIQQGSPPNVLDENARKALVSEYLEFKHLMMNLDPDEPDDDDDLPSKSLAKDKEGHRANQSSANGNQTSQTPGSTGDTGITDDARSRVADSVYPAADATSTSSVELQTPQRVPKLTILPPKPPEKHHHHHHHRSHKTRKTERHKKHHHKRKKSKLRSSEDESENEYSDPDFLV
ncbi:nipped-B cohesin loading factor [Lycorma delicatula]|uniref:nipped-B cohesin loading factor n=1 Tax=Lycorma delicatula TaxID=130591 RepID=UPI003F517435